MESELNSLCRSCGNRNLAFCSVHHQTIKKLLEYIPSLLNIHEANLPCDICIECFTMIKNLVFNIENIKDTQKILRIKNNFRQCQQIVSSPSHPTTSTARISFNNEVQVMQFKKDDSPSAAGTKQIRVLQVKKESTAISPKLLDSSSSQERKRSLDAEDIEKKYSNTCIKVRKVESNVLPSTSNGLVKKTIQTQSKIVSPPKASLVQKPRHIIVVEESAPEIKKPGQQIELPNQGNNKKLDNFNRSCMCTTCGKKFSNLEEHNHHKANCKKTIVAQKDLNIQINDQSVKKFSCHVCKNLFFSSDDLLAHTSTAHKVQYKTSPNAIITCKVCREKFSNVENLKKHSLKCKSKAIES